MSSILKSVNSTFEGLLQSGVITEQDISDINKEIEATSEAVEDSIYQNKLPQAHNFSIKLNILLETRTKLENLIAK